MFLCKIEETWSKIDPAIYRDLIAELQKWHLRVAVFQDFSFSVFQIGAFRGALGEGENLETCKTENLDSAR